jgi:hypothetical protein
MPYNSTLRRGQPLKRNASMPRSGPIERRTPLAVTGVWSSSPAPMLRAGPLRSVSDKRRRENRERAKVVAGLWPERPRCARPGCPRLADDVHEILTRARGGSITDPENFAPLCRACHDEATNEAPWAYEFGLLVHSWEATDEVARQ